MELPKQLENFSFVICNEEKQPIQKGWQNKRVKWDNKELQEHINKGGNYGVSCGDKSLININGELMFLIIVDFDSKEFQDKIIPHFPETFTTSSGSSKNCNHYWFATDEEKSFKIINEKVETLADIQGTGKQVISVGSKHPSGSVYSVVNDLPIAYIPYSELKALLEPHDKRPKKKRTIKEYVPTNVSSSVAEEIINSISLEEALEEIGIDTSKNPTNCFKHDSIGGKCLGYNDTTAHCFHCEGSWNNFSLIRDAKNLTDKETFDWFAKKAGRSEDLEKSRKDYKEEQRIEEIKVMTDKLTQAQLFLKAQPYFYDKNKIWWLWDSFAYRWEVVDEVDVLNMISKSCGQDIISSKARTETLNALKQEGRNRVPKPIKPTWIQFKDKIIDIETAEEIDASPEYFVTNPIPYKVGKVPDTPIMNKIFTEWVGEKNVELLYEILAYAILPDTPIHRIFCFVGGGMNGKSKYLELLRKFVGQQNCCSSELDRLLQSRFEVTRLHKKLVCQMGETNFNEMNRTSLLKQLSGGDLIGYEYKNKNPFEERNYAKIIIATNNLPTTSDKTIGFYRRWCIIDFPNTFSEKKDILNEIPEEEYEALALRSIVVLKGLLEKRTFTNEGTIEERMEKYESKSNFLEKFISKFTIESVNGYITTAEFNRKFKEWCKENRHREMSDTSIGISMKKLGHEKGRKYMNWLYDGKGGQMRVWLNMEWKE